MVFGESMRKEKIMKRRSYVAAACMAIGLALWGCSGSGNAQSKAAAAESQAVGSVAEGETADKTGSAAESSAETSEAADKAGSVAEESETADKAGSEAGKENGGTAKPEGGGEGQKEVVHSGFTFVVKGVTFGMNENVAPVLEALGDYENYSETTSCAFKGLDKIYSYGGFDLYTYPQGDQDFVNSVYIVDDSVSTPEGIRIGSSQEEMLAAYGEDYEEEYGVYTYTKDKSTLSFIVTDGVVESIEYVAITK